LLAPFALLGYWFCRYMPESNIGQNLIAEEEDEERMRGRDVELTSIRNISKAQP